MVDKSKMTVAEMLAAARKADNKGDAPADSAPAAAEASEAAAPAPPAAKKPAAGEKLSVAEIMAQARANKGESAAAPAAKESPKPAAKPAAAKAAPVKKEAAAPAGPVDTQSILTAARKGAQAGPMTKAEAAARGVAVAPPPKKPPKETIVVPPMPVKPDYAKKPTDRTKSEVAERRAFLFGMSALAVGFVAMGATVAFWTLGTVRFMFPNVLRLPPSRFKVGFPDTFAPGTGGREVQGPIRRLDCEHRVQRSSKRSSP